MGFIISKKCFVINENHIINYIGNKILKENTTIKIISNNKLYFYSYKKISMEWLLTYTIIPDIIFGDCNIIDNNVTINYKIHIFNISLIFLCIIFIFYRYIISLESIFLLCFIGILAFLQYLKLQNIQNDVEYYISNGK
jgi:hypothetical protein